MIVSLLEIVPGTKPPMRLQVATKVWGVRYEIMAHELEIRAEVDIRYLSTEKCESSTTCESVATSITVMAPPIPGLRVVHLWCR